MSISSGSIEKNLSLLKKQYDKAMSSSRMDASLEAALYSKFALLEFCGWLEETVDKILFDYIDRTITNIAVRKTIKEEIINRVYGFKYKEEFRPLFEKIIGAGNFQHIISRLASLRGRDELLKNKLAELTKARNRAAHTHHIKGVTPNYDAPSTTIENFKKLKPILYSIERMVKKMN